LIVSILDGSDMLKLVTVTKEKTTIIDGSGVEEDIELHE
jgi:hypothetical protein